MWLLWRGSGCRCVCMCVCVCMFVCACVCVNVCTCVYVCLYTYIHTNTHLQPATIEAFIIAKGASLLLSHIPYIYIYIYIYICTYTHTYTHPASNHRSPHHRQRRLNPSLTRTKPTPQAHHRHHDNCRARDADLVDHTTL